MPAILSQSTRYVRTHFLRSPLPLILQLVTPSSSEFYLLPDRSVFICVCHPSCNCLLRLLLSDRASSSSVFPSSLPKVAQPRMPSAVALRSPDRNDWLDWMNSLQCNGRCGPATAPQDYRNMHTSHATLKIDTDRRFSHHTTFDSSYDGPSSAKLRRRASQGSLRPKPSPVSRLLSKSSAALHFPSWDQRSSSPGSSSRNRPADSRLRLSTTVSRGPRPLTAHSPSPSTSLSPWDSVPSSFQSDYPSALPPTPPEDGGHIAWNPQSAMLLFDDHPHQDRGSSAMMDEGLGMDTSSTGHSDSLSSPSDGSSHGSSSSGSPGPHDEMDLQQDVGSWLDHGVNVTGKEIARSNVCYTGL